MKYAICNETFQDMPFEQAFALAADLGYTGIEIAPFTIAKYAYDISPERRQEVRRQAEKAGLEVIGLHWLLAQTEGFYLTSPEAAVRRKTGEYLTELVRLCQELGGHLMVLGSPKQRNLLPGVTHDTALDFAAEVIRQAAPTLEECQVTLAVEPLGPSEGNFLLTAASGRDLIERVKSPWVRLHLDVKAMSSEGRPIPEIICENADLLAHFHANDPNLLGPGMGAVKYEPIFQALRDVGYSGWVSVEVFNYEPGAERIGRESIEYMRQVEAKLAG